MNDQSASPGGPAASVTSAPCLPVAVERAAFQADLDSLRVREKAHTREGDAIAAARRRLPMVEVDASLTLTGPGGPLTLLTKTVRSKPAGQSAGYLSLSAWRSRDSLNLGQGIAAPRKKNPCNAAAWREIGATR